MTTVEELMKNGIFHLKVMAMDWGVRYAASKSKRELAEEIVALKEIHGEPPKREKKKCLVHKCEHGKKKGYCMVCDDRYLCCHGQQRRFCRVCGGSQVCKHGHVKFACAKCRKEKASMK